jgi:hypothetical protein
LRGLKALGGPSFCSSTQAGEEPDPNKPKGATEKKNETPTHTETPTKRKTQKPKATKREPQLPPPCLCVFVSVRIAFTLFLLFFLPFQILLSLFSVLLGISLPVVFVFCFTPCFLSPFFNYKNKIKPRFVCGAPFSLGPLLVLSVLAGLLCCLLPSFLFAFLFPSLFLPVLYLSLLARSLFVGLGWRFWSVCNEVLSSTSLSLCLSLFLSSHACGCLNASGLALCSAFFVCRSCLFTTCCSPPFLKSLGTPCVFTLIIHRHTQHEVTERTYET